MSTNPLPKRLLSLVLTFCMVLSLVPMSALAEGDPSSDPNRATTRSSTAALSSLSSLTRKQVLLLS